MGVPLSCWCGAFWRTDVRTRDRHGGCGQSSGFHLEVSRCLLSVSFTSSGRAPTQGEGDEEPELSFGIPKASSRTSVNCFVVPALPQVNFWAPHSWNNFRGRHWLGSPRKQGRTTCPSLRIMLQGNDSRSRENKSWAVQLAWSLLSLKKYLNAFERDTERKFWRRKKAGKQKVSSHLFSICICPSVSLAARARCLVDTHYL